MDTGGQGDEFQDMRYGTAVRALPAVALTLMLVGCIDSKSDLMAACYEEHVTYYLKPRPHGSPPDDFLLRTVDACMMSHGYRRDESSATCQSVRTTQSACYRAAGPKAWVRILFGG
jgi:hypothetical protein